MFAPQAEITVDMIHESSEVKSLQKGQRESVTYASLSILALQASNSKLITICPNYQK